LVKFALDRLDKIIDLKVKNMDQVEQELQRSTEKQKRNGLLLSGKYAFFENFKTEIQNMYDKKKF